MRHLISKNFYIDEFVQPDFYQKWDKRSIHWIRPELIKIIQFMRDLYCIPIIMNNWAIGGDRVNSGLRYPNATIGAGDSLHKFGCALDATFIDMPPDFYDQVRKDIKDNFLTAYQPMGLTTIEENTPSWLHFDIRYIPDQTQINLVYP